MPKFMIIDGNSIINRAFYGIRPLTNKDGLNTNAIYGFLNILFKYLDEEKPEYLAVSFDLKGPTFRNELYNEYKANRKGMPDELAEQMPYLKETLRAMNIEILELSGYEADDIIGTVSKKCRENSVECVILTGDKDDLQLASELVKVKLVISKGGKTTTSDYRNTEIVEQYGIEPQSFIEVKGLMGDPSDNIPGVKGIGEVTALSLIKEFGTLEKVYENLDSPSVKKGVREKLIENKDMAFLSRILGTILQDVPIDVHFENCLMKPYNNEELIKLFNYFNFESMLKKFNLKTQPKKEKIEVAATTDFNDVLKLDKFFYMINNDAIYILTKNGVFSDTIANQFEKLKGLFENPTVEKISFGMKEDIIALFNMGIDYKNCAYDIKIAQYLLFPSESAYTVDKIISEYIEFDLEDDADKYSIVVSKMDEIVSRQSDALKQFGLDRLFYDVEMKIVKILAHMTIDGIKVDIKKLEALKETIDFSIEQIKSQIYILAGEEFNLNSVKQLRTILFDKLNLPVFKKTKTGYSTGFDVLEKLSGKHEIIDKMIEYRQLAKLKSTYIDAILNIVDDKQLLHSNFHQTITLTGRLSSSDPNLQNIPARQELAKEIRKVFIPTNEDYTFLSADYSQIELRVLAHISNDDNMKQAFFDNEDIHLTTAANIFSVDKNIVTNEMRTAAKAINFGLVYGKGEYSLSQDLKITRKEAGEYIKNYLGKYPKVQEYMENVVNVAKEKGYVQTIMGRIRWIPELSENNFLTRAFGERAALNSPIQGSAADIMKAAMVKVYENIQGFDAKIVLQIHDELVLEVNKNCKEEVAKILKQSMEQVAKLSVPLTVKVSEGQNLFELK